MVLISRVLDQVARWEAPLPHPPINWQLRIAAGFSVAEVEALFGLRARRRGGQRKPAT